MIKRPQILPNIVILEKEDEKKWTDVIFKEVMIKNFLKLIEGIKPMS